MTTTRNQYVRLQSGTVLQTSDASNWPEAERLTVKDGKALLLAESIDRMREHLSPKDGKRSTLWTIVTHVASSGMSRSIRCFVIDGSQPIDVSRHVARITGNRIDDSHGGVRVGGCGMDMGFHLTYSVGEKLFPQGAKSEDKHSERCGGYAIHHSWL